MVVRDLGSTTNTPRHPEYVEALGGLANRVTARDGGRLSRVHGGGTAMTRPEFWLSDGWALPEMSRNWSELRSTGKNGLEGRLGRRFTVGGMVQPLHPAEPVDPPELLRGRRLSLAGRAARLRNGGGMGKRCRPRTGRSKATFVESARNSTPDRATVGRRSYGPARIFGDVWEWTAGALTVGYPGFRAVSEGALG